MRSPSVGKAQAGSNFVGTSEQAIILLVKCELESSASRITFLEIDVLRFKRGKTLFKE